jgi:hypothetical protein
MPFRLFSILIALLLSVADTYSQVAYEEKYFSASGKGDLDLPGFMYHASIPQFADSSAFFRELNAILLGYVDTTITGNSDSIPEEVANEESIDTSVEVTTYLNNEETEIAFISSWNSGRVLSFYVENYWQAGGGGMGRQNTRHPYNIDVNEKKYIRMEDLFSAKNLEKVMALSDAKLYEVHHLSVGETEDQSMPTTFTGFNLNRSSMFFYYNYYYSGSSLSTTEIDIPLAALRKYMSRKGKLLTAEL